MLGRSPLHQVECEPESESASDSGLRDDSEPVFKKICENDWAPPSFPGRPDLFDEVEWGPLPTSGNIKKAYRVWELQDSCLVEDESDPDMSPNPFRSSGGSYTCLARNVYETLMKNYLLPIDISQKDKNAQYRKCENGYSTRGWRYNEIFGSDDEETSTSNDQLESLSLNGHDILTDRYWTKARLQVELRSRKHNPYGLVADLRRLLYEDVFQEKQASGHYTDKGRFLPRQDLPDWDIHRKQDYMLKISTQKDLSPLDMYTWAILLSPYNPGYWTSRALLHYQMGHFDLAIGDAYRAQLLCEVLVNPLSRNTQPGLYIRVWDAIERHVLQISRVDGELAPEIQLLRKPNGINYFIPTVRKAIHHIISLSLLGMQCWEDYMAVEPYLRTRLVMAERDENLIRQREGRLHEFIRRSVQIKRGNHLEHLFERHYGFIVTQPYPYEAQDIAVAQDKIAHRINNDIFTMSQAATFSSPKLKVEIDEFDCFGVFATEDIPKDTIIYAEEPSIRGHLHQAFPIQDRHHCENCKRKITPRESGLEEETSNGRSSCRCSKLGNEPLHWCNPPPEQPENVKMHHGSPGTAPPNMSSPRKRSRAQTCETNTEGVNNQPSKGQKTRYDARDRGPSCLEIAQSLYHRHVCGKDWEWLHDAMRQNIWTAGEILDSWPRLSHTNEKHGTILSLLLREVFDITLLRRETDNKPNLLAHEIDELIPITVTNPTLQNIRYPFSFAANIKVPFDILSYMGVNIFRDLTFDTWVIQTVLRKLLVSAVPWHSDRTRQNDFPASQEFKKFLIKDIRKLDPPDFSRTNPAFPDLYVFPVMSMFGHSCPPTHNVNWCWDTKIPNRILLRTIKNISQGQELFLRYTKLSLTSDSATRLLGKYCPCPQCINEFSTSPNNVSADHYGKESSSDNDDDDSTIVDWSSPPHHLQGGMGELDIGDLLATARAAAAVKQPRGKPSTPYSPSTQLCDKTRQTNEKEREDEEIQTNIDSDLQDQQTSEHQDHYAHPTQNPQHNTRLEGENVLNPTESLARHSIGKKQQQNEEEVRRSPNTYSDALLYPKTKSNLNTESNPGPGPGQRVPSRHGGARVRYKGTIMTAQDFNNIREEEKHRRRERGEGSSTGSGSG